MFSQVVQDVYNVSASGVGLDKPEEILDLDRFNNKVEFKVSLLSYDGNDDWVETALIDAKETLNRSELPPADASCDFCSYRKETAVFE